MKRLTPENHASVTPLLDGVLAGLGLGLIHDAGSNGAATAAAAFARVRDWPVAATLARRHEVSALFLRGLRTCPGLLAASGIASTLNAQIARAKEAHLFDAPDYSGGWSPKQIDERYRPSFEHCPGATIRGEATPTSLPALRGHCAPSRCPRRRCRKASPVPVMIPVP